MSGRTLVATYDYPNLRGDVRLRKLRFDPKDFRLQTRWKPDGRWLPGVRSDCQRFYRTTLFRLPEVAAACRAGQSVWWCEGEKDSLSVVAAGTPATTTALSAEGTGIDHALHFKRHGARKVVIIADWDLAGASSALDRYTLSRQVGLDARVLAPPKPYGDAADALAAGRKLAHFRLVNLYKLAECAERYKAERVAGRSTYLSAEELAGLKSWSPQTVERSS